MNAAATFAVQPRLAVSPYARRISRERAVDLDKVAGSGPDGRIVAADVLAHRTPVAATPPEPPIPTRAAVFCFSAVVALAALYRLAADAARLGLDIAVEDCASRAAIAAFAGVGVDHAHRIAVEADGRQILICTASGRSIGADRRLRQEALGQRADVSAEPAAASLLVLHSARVAPSALPLLPGRTSRLVLVVDRDRELAHALLCADGSVLNEAGAVAALGAFVDAMEQPLALLV